MLDTKVKEILKRWDYNGDNLIEIMHDLMSTYNYLPPPILKEISKEIKVPLNKIFHLATFYEGFSLKERGKYTIWICVGTSCYVKGALHLVDCIKRELNIEEGETSSDKLFTLKTKACFGACGLAPAAYIGEDLYGNLTQAKMIRLLKRYKDKEKKAVTIQKTEVKHAQA